MPAGRPWLSRLSGVAFHLVEEPVEFITVEDKRRSLAQAAKPRTPPCIERPALHADVVHGFCIAQSPLHVQPLRPQLPAACRNRRLALARQGSVLNLPCFLAPMRGRPRYFPARLPHSPLLVRCPWSHSARTQLQRGTARPPRESLACARLVSRRPQSRRTSIPWWLLRCSHCASEAVTPAAAATGLG